MVKPSPFLDPVPHCVDPERRPKRIASLKALHGKTRDKRADGPKPIAHPGNGDAARLTLVRMVGATAEARCECGRVCRMRRSRWYSHRRPAMCKWCKIETNKRGTTTLLKAAKRERREWSVNVRGR